MSKQEMQEALGEISSVQEEIEKALQRKSKLADGEYKDFFIATKTYFQISFYVKTSCLSWKMFALTPSSEVIYTNLLAPFAI